MLSEILNPPFKNKIKKDTFIYIKNNITAPIP